MINRRLGDLDRLFPAENALGKFSELGKAPVKKGTREDGRQARLAKAFVQPLACEGLDVLPVVVYRLPIVAQREVGMPRKKVAITSRAKSSLAMAMASARWPVSTARSWSPVLQK